MKVQVIIMAVMALLVSGNLSAADKTPQQQKMTTCNQQASNQSLKGDARKAFMSTCLRKDSTTTGNSQQTKMKTCNTQASNKTLKGDERKAFMSQCLKKS